MGEPVRILSATALKNFESEVYKDVDSYVRKEYHIEFTNESDTVPLEVSYDAGGLSKLCHIANGQSANQDLENAKIVGESLGFLTPEIANEPGFWVRISHTECWEYSRMRWLNNRSGQELFYAIRVHIFSSTRERIRDHQAVARLWWSWYIAKNSWPANPERALELIFTSAYTRLNFVKRIWLCSREKIASAVLRAMDNDRWILRKVNFGAFMKVLNRYGGGIVFETLTDQECDEFVERCIQRVRKEI